MTDKERIEQLELENKVLQANNKGLKDKIDEQSKEIEELKEDNEKYKNPPFFDEDNYISKEEAEQKERKAYIKGTNDAHELCNKKWEDKIKAKIEPVLKQLDTKMKEEYNKYGNSREYQDIVDAYNFLQSLFEME